MSTPSSRAPVQDWLQTAGAHFARPVAVARNYRRRNLRPDLLAGLTVAVVMLPQAMAYALIAELPPQTGLYAAIVGAVVGALWGSSRHLHTGPTNATSLLVLGTLLGMGLTPDSEQFLMAAALLAVLAGVFRLLLGLFRLGFLTNFVSHAVVVGFTAGAGILIGANQLKHLFRVEVPSSSSFSLTVYETALALPETHRPSLLVGVGTILLLLAIRRWRPQWPSALIGMIGAAGVVALLHLDAEGVAVLGRIPRELPPLRVPPLLDGSMIRELAVGALAVAAIGLVEALSISRAIASQSGQQVDSNQEFVGQGLANIVTGFFSGYPISGSFTRSAVNYGAHAQTPLAAAFSGLWVLLLMFLLAPLAVFLPRAALAGLLIVTAYYMVDRKEMVHVWRTSRGDRLIMIATLAATLLLPLEFAVLTGIMVSFARYIARTSTPDVRPVVPDAEFEHFRYRPESAECPQLGVLTIHGSLYFGATAHVEASIREHMEAYPEQRFLLLRMHRVNLCDVSGLNMLESIVRLYRKRKGDVFMVGVRSEVWQKMRQGEFAYFLGHDHFLDQERAIAHIFYRILDPGYCIYHCREKIWRECQSLPKADTDVALPSGTPLPAGEAVPQLSGGELWTQLQNGERPLVIDVREPEEYEAGHVPGATLIPMPRILSGVEEVPRDRPVIFVCRSGRRSAQVVLALRRQGYGQIHNLEGGMLSWEDAGLPSVS